jgi:flagellar export protein FliJ
VRKFKFSMQGILNVNNTRKEVCEMELAEARVALVAEERKLADLEGQISFAMNPERIVEQVSGRYFIQREKYIRMLKNQRKKQIYNVQQAGVQVDSCVERLKEATIEVKRMEKARENEYKAWNLEYLRDEQKINDEIGSIRASYKRLSLAS